METVDREHATTVYQAVREGNVDAVREYLEAGGDPNMCNPDTGRTLLHAASRQGYPAVASLLLSKGANPAATTLRHLTPLHLACHQGHLKVARLLLEAWAPVDDRDEAGTSPLHLSAQKGYVDVVRLLLQCGADKDAVDESGWTPLFFASWAGHAAVTRMLLQAGANARVHDGRDKITPLHLACSWGQLEVAKVLLEFGADSSAKDCNGAFPESVIGAGSPDAVDPAGARELSEIVLGHRLRIKGASSSLECVVDSLRAKVSELEDQLARAGRDRLEGVAYSSDVNRNIFSAALKPECSVCQVEVKETVLEPCRHLAACTSCADSLESCPFCECRVQGYKLLESRQVYEHILALEDERAGLEAQLKRFSNRVRDLVAENGDLKVKLRRAKSEVSVLTAERRGLEERFLLRTPSPPPAPTVGGTTVAVSGRTRGANEQQVGRDKSGYEVAPPGVIPPSGAGPRAFKAVVLDQALPRCDGDYPDRHVSAAADTQASGASSGRSVEGRPYPGDVGVTLDGGNEDRSKVAVGVASALHFEAAEAKHKVAPGLERESDSGSSKSESDDGFWAFRGSDDDAGQARSSQAFDSCDSASSECGLQESTLSEGATGKLNGVAGHGDQETLASSNVQAAGGAFDSAFQLDVVRPRRRRAVLSRSLQPQSIRTRTSSEKLLGKASMGGTVTGTIAEGSLRPTDPLSTSLPGSFLVAGGGGADEVENDAWPSGSFITAKRKVKAARDGQDQSQVSTDTSPLEGTESTAERPLVKQGQEGHEAQGYTFLNDGSQSSSDSRSPGG